MIVTDIECLHTDAGFRNFDFVKISIVDDDPRLYSPGFNFSKGNLTIGGGFGEPHAATTRRATSVVRPRQTPASPVSCLLSSAAV